MARARPQPFTEPSQRRAAGHEQLKRALLPGHKTFPGPTAAQPVVPSQPSAGRRSRALGCFGPPASLCLHSMLQPSPGDGEVQQTCSKPWARLLNNDKESSFPSLWASYGTVASSPQRGLLGKGPWLSLRHFIGLMMQNQVSGRKSEIWSVVLPAHLPQCSTSTAGQCNVLQ